jgi:hypothetical protein
MLNGSREEDATFTLPEIPVRDQTRCWSKIIDTAAAAPADFVSIAEAASMLPGEKIRVKAMAVTVLQSAERRGVPREKTTTICSGHSH